MSASTDTAAEWLTWQRDKVRLQPQTLDRYARTLTGWLVYCQQHQVNVLAPELEDLEAFVSRKKANGRVRKASSVALDCSVLKTWYAWAFARNMLHVDLLHSPAVNLVPPKVKHLEPRPVLDHDWQVLWNSDMSPNVRVMLGLGYYVGLRREELHTLARVQVSPTRIVHFIRKGGGEDTLPWLDMASVVHTRLPHLLPDLSTLTGAIGWMRNQQRPRVSPYVSIDRFRFVLREMCLSRGLPPYHPHQLRHSCATNLVRAEVPLHLVKEYMNHASMDTTMRYVATSSNELREWLNRNNTAISTL